MIEKHGRWVREVERVLREEIQLQLEYASILEEENSVLSKFNAEKLEYLSAKRGEICERIMRFRDVRRDLVLEIRPDGDSTITKILNEEAHPTDRSRLVPLCEKLKILVNSNRARSSEYSCLANFALGVVNGTLSLIWSATQSVTRAYGRSGKINESYAPKTREQLTLKEA